jgi:hypothetical protein
MGEALSVGDFGMPVFLSSLFVIRWFDYIFFFLGM